MWVSQRRLHRHRQDVAATDAPATVARASRLQLRVLLSVRLSWQGPAGRCHSSGHGRQAAVARRSKVSFLAMGQITLVFCQLQAASDMDDVASTAVAGSTPVGQGRERKLESSHSALLKCSTRAMPQGYCDLPLFVARLPGRDRVANAFRAASFLFLACNQTD